MIASSVNTDSFHALNPNSNLNANPTSEVGSVPIITVLELTIIVRKSQVVRNSVASANRV